MLPSQAPIGTHPALRQAASSAKGLEIAFLILLGTVLAAGVFLIRARVTYPEDVATAAASDQANRPVAVEPAALRLTGA